MENFRLANLTHVSLKSLPIRVRLLVGLAFAFTVFHFVVTTQSVRLANSDDTVCQQIASAGEIVRYFTDASQSQGRFYYATPLYQVPWLLYSIESPVGFAMARATLFFVAVVLLGCWLAQLTHSAAWAMLYGLVAVAALHLPPQFYPVLSYPNISLGFIALLGAMLAQANYARDGSFVAGLASGACFLAACLLCEVFIVYAPFVILQAWRDESPRGRLFLRRSLPIVAGVIGYVAVYALFASTFKSTYSGTRFSVNISDALLCLWRQTAACVPGFELLAKRTVMGAPGPFWRQPAEVLHLFRDLPFASLALVVLQVCATAVLLDRISRESVAVSRRVLVLAVALVVLPNLPISLTARYQVTAHQRMYPYVYSYYAYLALVFLVLACWHRLTVIRPGWRWRRAWVCAGVALAALLDLSAQAANRKTLAFLVTGSSESTPVASAPSNHAVGK